MIDTKNCFFPDAIELWKNLDESIKNSSSLTVFKASLTKLIRPLKKDTFNINDSSGLKLLFQLRTGLSPLRSHKYRQKFIDTPSDHCGCLTGAETTTHFFFECP